MCRIEVMEQSTIISQLDEREIDIPLFCERLTDFLVDKGILDVKVDYHTIITGNTWVKIKGHHMGYTLHFLCHDQQIYGLADTIVVY